MPRVAPAAAPASAPRSCPREGWRRALKSKWSESSTCSSTICVLCAPAAPARDSVPVAAGQLARTLHSRGGERVVLPGRQLHPEWLPPLVAIHLWDVALEAILEHHVGLVVVIVVRLLKLPNLRQGRSDPQVTRAAARHEASSIASRDGRRKT